MNKKIDYSIRGYLDSERIHSLFPSVRRLVTDLRKASMMSRSYMSSSNCLLSPENSSLSAVLFSSRLRQIWFDFCRSRMRSLFLQARTSTCSEGFFTRDQRTPQALQSVLQPSGPRRHMGVLFVLHQMQARSGMVDVRTLEASHVFIYHCTND